MRNDQKEVEKMFEDESLHFTARVRDIILGTCLWSRQYFPSIAIGSAL